MRLRAGRRGGMADAIDLGSITCKGVEVQVLSSALAGKKLWARGLAGRRLLCKEKIVGSNPTGSTQRKETRFLRKTWFLENKK